MPFRVIPSMCSLFFALCVRFEFLRFACLLFKSASRVIESKQKSTGRRFSVCFG